MSATTVVLGSGVGGVGSSSVGVVGNVSVNSQADFLNYLLTNPNSPCYLQSLDLANGFQAVTIPVKAGGVVIAPDQNCDFNATLKGVTGDTGILLAKRGLHILTFDSPPPASFGLTWAGRGKLDVTVVGDAGTDFFTAVAHGLSNGDRVRFRATGTTGAVPGGIVSLDILYYVVNKTNDTFQVSATLSGVVVDLTTTGTNVVFSTVDNFELLWF